MWPLKGNKAVHFLILTSLFLAILTLGRAIWGNTLPPQENAPQSIVVSYDTNLGLIQGNSLFPISYLPLETHIFGVVVGEEEILINNYCDTDYLKNFWPAGVVKEASAICFCESLGESWRINNSRIERSVGLFQINLLAHKQYTEAWLKIPENNIRAAIDIYNSEKENEKWQDWWNCGKMTGIIK